MRRKVGREWGPQEGPASPRGCGLLGETHTTRGEDMMPLFNLPNVVHQPKGNVDRSDLPHFNTPVTMGFYENTRRRDLTSGVE